MKLLDLLVFYFRLDEKSNHSQVNLNKEMILYLTTLNVCLGLDVVREHSHMTSDVFWAFLTYLRTYLPKKLDNLVHKTI